MYGISLVFTEMSENDAPSRKPYGFCLYWRVAWKGPRNSDISPKKRGEIWGPGFVAGQDTEINLHLCDALHEALNGALLTHIRPTRQLLVGVTVVTEGAGLPCMMS